MATGDLTTLANVKGYMNQVSPDTGIDTVLARLISASSKWFAEEFRASTGGRLLLQSPQTKTLDGNGKCRLMLPHFPVSDVTSVEMEGLPVAESTGTDVTGWLLADPGAGELGLRDLLFTKGMQNVEVAYTAGCFEWTDDLANIPADIAQAVTELVVIDFKRGPRPGIASENVAGSSTNYSPPGIPASVRAVLDSYRSKEW